MRSFGPEMFLFESSVHTNVVGKGEIPGALRVCFSIRYHVLFIPLFEINESTMTWGVSTKPLNLSSSRDSVLTRKLCHHQIYDNLRSNFNRLLKTSPQPSK